MPRVRDCPPVPAHTDLDGTGAPPAAGPALQSRSPRGRRHQQRLPLPRPNHPLGTRAAASQHVCRGRRGTEANGAEHSRSRDHRRGGSSCGSRSGANGGLAAGREGGLPQADPSTLCAAGSLSPLPGLTLPPPRISGCAPGPAPTRRAGGGIGGAPGAPGAQPATSARRFCGQALGELAGPMQGCVGRRDTEGHVAEEPWS